MPAPPPDSTLRLRRLDPRAIVPTRGSEHAIGLDLYAMENVTLAPGTQQLIPSGWAMQPPEGHYIRIAPRSGLALGYGIQINAGVCDRDYLGVVMALLYYPQRAYSEPLLIAAGSRFAQVICERAGIFPAEIVDVLDPSERGEGGWGSSGA